VRKILLAAIGTLSIATAVAAHPVATQGSLSSGAAGHAVARVLEPGSRGDVVEV
jgi:hypothetical protein